MGAKNMGKTTFDLTLVPLHPHTLHPAASLPPAASGRLPSSWSAQPGPDCTCRRRRWLRQRRRRLPTAADTRADEEANAAAAAAAAAATSAAVAAALAAAIGTAADPSSSTTGPAHTHAGDGMVLLAVLLCTLLRGARLVESKVGVGQGGARWSPVGVLHSFDEVSSRPANPPALQVDAWVLQ